MTNTPPPLPTSRNRRPLIERVSIVWLVPIVALGIALSVAYRSYMERGPLIEIEFAQASGVNAGETELRFRDVTVGLVEKVAFSDDLQTVVVSVRLDQAIADFVDEGSRFWVVQPEVSLQGVSGLDTVLSGVFIEGIWDSEPGGTALTHRGLTEPPLLRAGETGVQLILRALPGTSLTEGAPILYKGIVVGRVGRPDLTLTGSEARAEIVIFDEYRNLVTTRTRFWDSSGFRFSLGAQGAELDFSSIATLVSGGVVFDTPVSGGQPVRDGQFFALYTDEEAARTSLFSENEGTPVNLSVVFDENVSGLNLGALVEFRGVVVGEVTNINGLVDVSRFGDNRARLVATLAITPARLGLGGDDAETRVLDFFETASTQGMRARLASAGLLTGALKVEIVEISDAPAATFDRSAQPYPALPGAPANLSDVTADAQNVLQRVENLPIEELMQSAISMLDNMSTLVASEEVGAVPAQLEALLTDLRAYIGQEATQALPSQAAKVLEDLDLIIVNAQTLLRDIEQAQIASRLQAALSAVEDAANAVPEAVNGMPELVATVNEVAQNASALPLEDLVAQTNALISSADQWLSQSQTQEIPEALNQALSELSRTGAAANRVFAALEADGVVERLSTALEAASQAANAVETSVADVPALVDELNSVANEVSELPLEELITSARNTASAAETLLSAPDTQALANTLTTTLDEFQSLLADLNQGGAAENVNTTLQSASDAAQSIDQAAQALPGLVSRIDALLAQTARAIETLEPNGRVSRGAQEALREAEAAAAAFKSLARTIERNPSSVLLGR